MARRQATSGRPVLIIMCGFSGSGKTWLAERLMAALPAIRIRSDIERKRLFGLEETEASGSGIGTGIYSAQASATTYERLFTLARGLLEARHNVVLDAAFLKREQREAARAVAVDTGAVGCLVYAEAPPDVLRSRIRKRAMLRDEASEADLAVLEHQLETAAELLPGDDTLVVDTDSEIDIEDIVQRILRRNPH